MHDETRTFRGPPCLTKVGSPSISAPQRHSTCAASVQTKSPSIIALGRSGESENAYSDQAVIGNLLHRSILDPLDFARSLVAKDDKRRMHVDRRSKRLERESLMHLDVDFGNGVARW